MRRSVRVMVAATVALLGLGHGPADASYVPPLPGIGANICDGFTGTCTNPLFIRPVVAYASSFSPSPGGFPAPHPQVWSVGRVKAAEGHDELFSTGAKQVFAVGKLRVRPFATGFVSISTTAVGRFIKSNNPSFPYQFEGFALSHDPDLLRGQDFEFIGEQTGPIPPASGGQQGR